MMTLKTSPQYAAADLFRYAPIAGTASIFHGVRKAVMLFLVVQVVRRVAPAPGPAPAGTSEADEEAVA